MTVPSMRVWDFRTVHVFWFWCRSINDAKHDQLRRTFATAIDSSKISTLREVEASKGKKVGNWGSFVHNKVDPQSTCQPCMMFLMTTLNDSSSWGNGKQVKIIYFPAHALSILFIDFSTYYQPAFDLATSASSLHWLTPDMPPCILTQMKNGRNYLTFSWEESNHDLLGRHTLLNTETLIECIHVTDYQLPFLASLASVALR